jgi:pimeloyl-ACP methyl ester carboxylesterase
MTTVEQDAVRSADGTRIAFDRYGEGPLVVLVGGLVQHRAIDQSTSRLAGLLAAGGRTVIHYDRRGRGDSTDTAPFAVERELEDLAAVIEANGGAGAAFGMSSGGVLGLEAVLAGMPLTRLAIYEPPLRTALAPPGAPGLADTIDALCAAGRRADAVELMLGDIMGQEGLRGLRASPVWPRFLSIAPTFAYDTRLLERTYRDGEVDAGRWSGVSIPLLVMDGGESPEWMRTAAATVAAAVPGARAETFPGQTHEVDIDVLAAALGGFFA